MSQVSHPYQRIAEELRREIVSGRLAPGAAVPSVRELAKRHQVAFMTAHRAVEELRDLGLVVTQGRRTIVRPAPPVRLLQTAANHLTRRTTGVANWNAEVLAQGHRPEQRLLHVGRVPAPAEVAVRLEVEDGEPVVVRRRLHLIDDVPVSLQAAYYPASLAAGTRLELPQRITGGAHPAIEERLGYPIARMVEDLVARMPTDAEARALKLQGRGPVVRVMRTAYGAAGDPVEVLDSVMDAERHEFRYVVELSE